MQTLKVYSHLIFCFAFLNGYMINLISSRIIKKFFINSSCTVCGFPLKNDKLYNKSTAYGCWRLDFFVSDIKTYFKLFYLYQRLQCRDNYFFKIKFVFFLYLQLSASKENDLPLCIYF
jgi:hypothetical protein